MLSTDKSASQLQPSSHVLAEYIYRLEAGEALLQDTPQNLVEVVGVLKSYGVVLDAYSRNLNYIAEHQFLVFLPFFKYFNGDVSPKKLLQHWYHDRINFEYAEYCMRAMMWHGGGGLDDYLDSDAFSQAIAPLIQAKFRNNPVMLALHKLFPDFLPEHLRQMAYYSALGQFWRVMSDLFLALSDRYDEGKIKSIPEVVAFILNWMGNAANQPITYSVTLRGQTYDLIPKSVGLTFLSDTGVPYVEAVFFRGTPFPGTISFNAQAYQIPLYQSDFAYGALYADPLPIGGAGIPPTQLMQDMRHYLPDYLMEIYRSGKRGESDLRVKICESFQRSMFCVTTAAIQALAPFPLTTTVLDEQKANRRYLEQWMDRFLTSRLQEAQGNPK
jgi:CO2 hydration protein